MDCTTASNTSAMLKQDDNTDERNCSGGVANNDGVEQQINKAVTSSSNPKQPGQDEQQPIQQPYIGIVTTKVLKGKRTKRQRLHSSESFSSTYNHQETDDLILAENEEQLDLANCLILLAQGQSRPSPPPALSSIIRNGSSIFTKLSGNKRSSSSLNMEGIYECKTCNRTFSSFQALGGHRASHNKLNISTSHQNLLISPAINPNTPSPLSLQLGNINYGCSITSTSTSSAIIAQSNNFKSINKIHECSICGAEFSSGQALGGHMRRHRGPVIPQNSSAPITNTTTANTTLSLSNAVDVISAATAGKVERISNNNEFLSLDLNLPASPSPEDTKYSLPPKQQSTGLLFSTTPALVDCF